MTWTRKKVSYRKVRSRGGRWSGPKVHIARYDPRTRNWEPVCATIRSDLGIGMGYGLTDDQAETTCKLCLKKGVDNR